MGPRSVRASRTAALPAAPAPRPRRPTALVPGWLPAPARAALGGIAFGATLLGSPPPAAAQAAPPAAPAAAPPADSGALTLARIFGSAEFRPQRPPDLRWLAGGDAYTTLEPSPSLPNGTDLVRYDAATGRRAVLVPAARLVPPGDSAPLAVEDYTWSPDGRRLLVFTRSERVWRQNTRGDYWLVDVAGGAPRQLGRGAPPSSLMFAKFSPDNLRVAYVREHNLYVEDLAGARAGAVTPLTRDGSRTVINGTFDWVNEEELNLRDGFRWSPDGRRIAYWQLDDSGVRDYLLLNTTDSLYAYTIPVQFPKAGTVNSAVRAGVVDAAGCPPQAGGCPTRWLDVPGDPRNTYVARMEWAANSDEVVLQRLTRRQDTLQVLLGDARTGRTRLVRTERDPAWVDVVNDLRWLDGGRRFTWVSEQGGWRHLYSVARDGGAERLLTPGAFDLHNPASAFGAPLVLATNSARGLVYFTASPDNATQLYLYRARLDGRGRPERVTPAGRPGTHTYDVSPNGRWAVHGHSAFGVPPAYDIVRLPDHATVRPLADNAPLRARLATLERGSAEFFRVEVPADSTTSPAGGAGGRVALDGWLIKPPKFDPAKRYPLLFYVYGEPAAQTVLDAWGGSTYLWFLMLAEQGYLVASVDNRGTPAPRGHAWRTSVHGAVGVLASADQAAAARALAGRPYVDSARVGVWGWSGGGSMTLNLLFRSPALYRMGMAVAPVSDQRDYDTIYQERYMGLPQENPEGYRRGSPITYAADLRGDLLVVHGSGDDNVHVQGTEQLVNALVAANKPFTAMVYPNRSHCICEGPGTSRHLFELLTRYLHEHLPAGGR